MDPLSPELVVQVAHRCALRSLARLAQTCRALRELLRPHLQRRLALTVIVSEEDYSNPFDSSFWQSELPVTYLLWAARRPHPIHVAQARHIFDIARTYECSTHASTPRPFFGNEVVHSEPRLGAVKRWLNSDGTVNLYSTDHLRRVFEEAALFSNIALLELLIDEITLRPPKGLNIRLDMLARRRFCRGDGPAGGKPLFARDGRILYNAVRAERRTEVMQLLIARARVDVSGMDLTGVMYAIMARGLVDLFRLLSTALMRGSKAPDLLSRLRVLILSHRAAASPDTYLQVAARAGHADIIEILIDEGGWDVNCQGECDRTPLDNALLGFRERRPAEPELRDAFDARMRRAVASLVERGGMLIQISRKDNEDFLFR